MMKQLESKNLSVTLSGRPIVRDVSFKVPQGRTGCLLGPSGCGKTTLLRTIAGFELPEQGRLLIGGTEVSRSRWALVPERRRVGMVFQDFALFPNLCVRDNIGFGLKESPRSAREQRVNDMLRLVGLRDLAKVHPHQLSGGEQQRVALARALAPRPDILLLDEPFSSMDVDLREQLLGEVRTILHQEGITAIFVTHNQFEAFALADEIGVMSAGRLLQWNSGYNLYHHPKCRFVADFVGQGVFIQGTVLDRRGVATTFGIISGRTDNGFKPGEVVDVLIRPDDIVPDKNASIRARVVDRVFQGATFRYTLELNGTRVLCLAPSHYHYQIDEAIPIRLDSKHLVAFRREGAAPVDGSSTVMHQ